jgi:hypothetical protein
MITALAGEPHNQTARQPYSWCQKAQFVYWALQFSAKTDWQHATPAEHGMWKVAAIKYAQRSQNTQHNA